MTTHPELPKLDVPEKYQPFEDVSLDRNHPDREKKAKKKFSKIMMKLYKKFQKDVHKSRKKWAKKGPLTYNQIKVLDEAVVKEMEKRYYGTSTKNI